jgi:hypothetical protein
MMKTSPRFNPFKCLLLILLCSAAFPMLAQAYTEHPGGNISTDERWPPGTHYVTGSITVSNYVQLTLEPGVVVKFAPGVQMVIYGRLSAVGTSTASDECIVFTSRDDDAVGETIDTSDGIAESGDWYGIYLNGYSTYQGIGEFDYCQVRYGGNTASFFDANVMFSNSDAGHFVNSVSASSASDGVRVLGCSSSIERSTIEQSERYGIYVESERLRRQPGHRRVRLLPAAIWGQYRVNLRCEPDVQLFGSGAFYQQRQ